MGQLTYLIATSLDGRIAAADGDFSRFPMGDHIDWLVDRFPETFPAPWHEATGTTPGTETFDTVVMGSSTYGVGADQGLTDPYPHLDQWVFSRRRDAVESAGLHITDADPRQTVANLLGEGRRIWLCGGGDLAQQLSGSIDRMILKVSPIILGGQGVPLFAGDGPAGPWVREGHESFASGVTVTTYGRPR